jgi:ADP-ribosylglycohydrolase
MAAAAATAAAVSAAIDGASPLEIIAAARRAAVVSARETSDSPSATFAEAVHTIHKDLSQCGELRPADVADRYFPSSPLTIVPLALALGVIADSVETAVLLATNVGGDSDSVASIAGAIVGARCPATVNEDWYAVVEAVNGHDLAAIAGALGALRC